MNYYCFHFFGTMTDLIFSFFVILFLSRIFYLTKLKRKKSNPMTQCKVLVVIGSGGHTLEMIKHIKSLNPSLYAPRLYVMANTDTYSEYKIQQLENEFKNDAKSSYEIIKIPRGRTVGQSYFTSVFTTIYSTLRSIPIVFNFKPNLILCNGPGTCIPICAVGFLMNVLIFFDIKIVFVESICRVKTLSLSGKILMWFADVIIVQWEDLYKKYPKTVFLGRLI